MPDLLPAAVTTALGQFETELADPSLRPRNEEELIARLEYLVGAASVPTPNAVYVPDAEAPTTPDDKDVQIAGPLALVEPQARALSARAKALVANLIAMTAEQQSITSGLTATMVTLAAKVVATQSLVGSSSLQWMSLTDRFLDLSHIDPSMSTSITVETTTGNGVSLAPTDDQDLTTSISTLTLVQSRSGNGLPGDNLELSAIQAVPGTTTPAAGSTGALAATLTATSSSGGTGQEPTVSYSGVPDLFADLSAVVSSTPDYFDWETIYVPPVQKCSKQGTAYVADENGGTEVDVLSITQNYGWKATVQNADGTTRSAPLAVFAANPPIPGRDGPLSNLQLNLEIDMGQGVPINQLGLTVRQVGGLWPTISGVDVSLDHSQWQPMRCQGSLTWQGSAAAAAVSSAIVDSGGTSATATGNSVLGGSVWEIPSYASVDPTAGVPLFRYVSITFVQSDCYVCPKGIGHPYYVKVTQTNKSGKALFGLISSHSSSTSTQRLATPDALVGVTAGQSTTTTGGLGQTLGGILGAAASVLPVSDFGLGTSATIIGNKVKPTTNVAGSIVNSLGGVGAAVSAVVSGLIGSNSKTVSVLQDGEYNDVFQAYRQCISVGRIQPLARTYPTDTPGQLVSEPISFGHPFTAVRMFVDQREGSGTTISYDISIDDGGTWLPITPYDLGQPPPPAVPSISSSTLDLQGTYNTVRYRATFTTTQAHAAPRLLGVSLEALPA
jgi:hypothetical protein